MNLHEEKRLGTPAMQAAEDRRFRVWAWKCKGMEENEKQFHAHTQRRAVISELLSAENKAKNAYKLHCIASYTPLKVRALTRYEFWAQQARIIRRDLGWHYPAYLRYGTYYPKYPHRQSVDFNND